MFIPSIEHQSDSMAGKWESSDSTEHTKSCHEQFDCLHPRTLAKLQNLGERKMRLSLAINDLEVKTECDDTIKVLNRDRGNIVNKSPLRRFFPQN